jgi:hypothetical protein
MYQKEQKIQLAALNKSFDEYLDLLEKNYKEFEFDVYFLKPDYKDTWHFDREIPKELIENENLEFFLAEEYIDLVKDFVLEDAIFLTDSEFFTKYIDKRVGKFDNIKKINERLYEFFRSINELDKWRLIRGDFFNLNKINFIPSSNNSILKEVAILRKINNQGAGFNEKSTLRDYFMQVEIARQSVESKPDGKV